MKNIMVLLLIPCLVIALQVFFAKRKNKWLGLILPFICIAFSLLGVLSMAAFTSYKTEVTTVTENGEVIKEVVETSDKEPLMSTSSMILSGTMIFGLYNIPTIILIGIYVGCREKKRKNLELEKMSIQDLE